MLSNKAAVTGVALLLVTAGCGGYDGVVVNSSDSAEPSESAVVTTPLDGITEVRLDARSAGVDVRSAPGARAEVRQEIETHEGGDPNRPRHQVDGTSLRLRDCGRDCSIRYVVTLPEPVPVTGELTSGALDVDGMREVDVTGGSGRLKVARVDGPVRVRTTTGRIELDGVRGSVDVESTTGQLTGEDVSAGTVAAKLRSGQIDLGLTAPRDVRAETATGTIALRVPDGPYRVDAQAGVGSRDVRVAEDPGSDRRLALRVETGGIEVEPG